MITFGSYSTRIRSPCAAAMPAMASLTSVSGVLINFLSRVVTAASAIAASSYLCAVGKTRRNMNLPIPFPISSPSPMATRLMIREPASKRRPSNATSTAPIANPLPPKSRSRVQGCHLDRREEPNQRRHDDTDRQRRHICGGGHPVLDDPEDGNHQDCRDQDLGARPDPPRIDLECGGIMADQQRVRPVRGKDEPTLDPIRATAVDHRLGSVLVVVDKPVPDERDTGCAKERADDLRADVARHL